MKTQKTWATFWHQHKNKALRDHNYLFKKTLGQGVKNIAPLLFPLRQTLDATDVKNTRLANEKSAEAFAEMLKSLRTFSSESEAAGFLDGYERMAGGVIDSLPGQKGQVLLDFSEGTTGNSRRGASRFTITHLPFTGSLRNCGMRSSVGRDFCFA